MAADGSNGPKPYTQRFARTTFIRVPQAYWPKVKRGYISAFVGPTTQQHFIESLVTPFPVVSWCLQRGTYDCRLMILESAELTILGAVNAAELGFDSFAEFRRDWMNREKRRFPPALKVVLYRVSLWTPERVQEMKDAVFNHLYGDFTDGRRDDLSQVA